MDDADRAQIEIERAQQEAIDKALLLDQKHRLTCDTCGHELAWHRRPRGRCVECQEEKEKRQRMAAWGV